MTGVNTAVWDETLLCECEKNRSRNVQTAQSDESSDCQVPVSFNSMVKVVDLYRGHNSLSTEKSGLLDASSSILQSSKSSCCRCFLERMGLTMQSLSHIAFSGVAIKKVFHFRSIFQFRMEKQTAEYPYIYIYIFPNQFLKVFFFLFRHVALV